MADDRRTTIDRLVAYVADAPPTKPRVVVVEARHATGLSGALSEVTARVPAMRSTAVIDDAQRLIARGDRWFAPDQHLRLLLGVDVDDAHALGVDVVRA